EHRRIELVDRFAVGRGHPADVLHRLRIDVQGEHAVATAEVVVVLVALVVLPAPVLDVLPALAEQLGRLVRRRHDARLLGDPGLEQAAEADLLIARPDLHPRARIDAVRRQPVRLAVLLDDGLVGPLGSPGLAQYARRRGRRGLLHDVRDLVGEQPGPRGAPGRVLTLAEYDVASCG